MEDLSLRAEFHRAMDVVAPPAPWLAESVRTHLRNRRQPVARRGAAHPGVVQPSWLLPALAVLLAIAIVATLLIGLRALHSMQTVPVRPPNLGSGAACPSWSTSSSGGGSSSAADVMSSTSIGWSTGALRTVDGGAHWHDVSPAAMRADAPRGSGARAYPPAYSDFFLNAEHAWMARSYSSATSCFDHETVFLTSDGGRTWSKSAPIDAPVRADSSLQLILEFIDPRHGWLMVLGSGRLAQDWFVYSTSDGGADWQQVANLPPTSSFCAVVFVSQTSGYLGGCNNSGGFRPSLIVTRDGGKTWEFAPLPQPLGSSFTVHNPVFFDQDHGVIWVTAQVVQGNTETPNDYLAGTSDGGRSWQLLPNLPPGFATAFGFLDANHFWVMTSDGKGANESLYGSSDGGRTWALLTSELQPLIQSYPEVEFVDARDGFILEPAQQIGQGPQAVLVTTDGGRTWTTIHPQIA